MLKLKSSIKFSISPIKNSIMILVMFLSRIGLFLLTANGIATPMMNKKAGKTRSAQVKPFHFGWTSHQAAPSISSRWSAIAIPRIVKPRYASKDNNLYLLGSLTSEGTALHNHHLYISFCSTSSSDTEALCYSVINDSLFSISLIILIISKIMTKSIKVGFDSFGEQTSQDCFLGVTWYSKMEDQNKNNDENWASSSANNLFFVFVKDSTSLFDISHLPTFIPVL